MQWLPYLGFLTMRSEFVVLCVTKSLLSVQLPQHASFSPELHVVSLVLHYFLIYCLLTFAIIIDRATCSGKTTTAKRLCKENSHVIAIHQDHFYQVSSIYYPKFGLSQYKI